MYNETSTPTLIKSIEITEDVVIVNFDNGSYWIPSWSNQLIHLTRINKLVREVLDNDVSD